MKNSTTPVKKNPVKVSIDDTIDDPIEDLKGNPPIEITIPEEDVFKVKIGYLDYSIIYSKIILDSSRKELLGYFEPEPQRISIKEDLSDAKSSQILLHEIIHAMNEMYGINLSEKKVDKIAMAFASFFRENMDFVETLIQNLQD